jgi:hypothetical protein
MLTKLTLQELIEKEQKRIKMNEKRILKSQMKIRELKKQCNHKDDHEISAIDYRLGVCTICKELA